MREDTTVRFAANVYSLDVVKRAAYALSGAYSFDISQIDEHIVCRVYALNGVETLDGVEERFRNAVLDYDLRARISQETEAVRNVILANAFSRTGLQD